MESCIFDWKIQRRMRISCHCWNIKHRWARFSFTLRVHGTGQSLLLKHSLWQFINSLPRHTLCSPVIKTSTWSPNQILTGARVVIVCSRDWETARGAPLLWWRPLGLLKQDAAGTGPESGRLSDVWNCRRPPCHARRLEESLVKLKLGSLWSSSGIKCNHLRHLQQAAAQKGLS